MEKGINMSNDKIVAVTVTFNDYEYLKKALFALRKQTMPLYKIVVVDNYSRQELREQLKTEEDKLVKVLYLDSNLGGAGGFEEGMRYASEKYNPDWYWLMDADAYPAQNCLENLLKNREAYSNIGILAPLIYGGDLQEYQLYHHKKMVNFLARDIAMYDRYEDIPYTSLIEADAFVGPLVSKIAVDRLGIADGSLFIYGDDLEYTYRVSREFDVVLVKDAIINHRDQPVNGIQKPNNWWKDYYMYRNRIVFVKKFGKSFVHKFLGISFVMLRCMKQYLLSFSLPYSRGIKELRRRVLLQGIRDGLRSITGKTVDPQVFRSEVENEE